MNILVIALGGALGSVIRYLMVSSIQNRFTQFHHGFPLGTMAVNVFGSFLIGLLLSNNGFTVVKFCADS